MNANMANMATMGGPVGPPMGMMNNGAVPPPQAPSRPPSTPFQDQRVVLNTYIYDYFLHFGMYEAARALLKCNAPLKVQKDGLDDRRDENGNIVGNGVGDDSMDTDSKEDIDAKRPSDLPQPLVPMPSTDSCFLYDWFSLFWDMFNSQKGKGGNNVVTSYVNHTQVSPS